MSTAQTATPAAAPGATKNLRRKKKAEGREKRALRLKTDKEFAKSFFEGKSKRAIEKKAAFRKKKSKKK
jgi:hypothetical protein